MAKKISLTRGKYAIVDNKDYEDLSQFSWWANKCGRKWRAVRSYRKDGKCKKEYMHRRILSWQIWLLRNHFKCEVDHINGNPLDNRKSNLRLCTHRQNIQNRCGNHIRKSSKYKGVCRHKGKWMARICDNYLGRFKSEKDAALAYDAAAEKLYSKFAYTNF